MRNGTYCLNCTWFTSLHVAEGAKQEICRYPEAKPRFVVIDGEGYQVYADDPARKNANHDCADFTSRFREEPSLGEEAATTRDAPFGVTRLFTWFAALSLTALLLGLQALGGCSAIDVGNAVPFMAHPTTTKELAVPDAPAIAYDRSVQTIMAMGGIIAQLQPETHRISAQLYGAVAVNVVITPAAAGSLLAVSQRVSDGHIAYAPVRVCEQFFETYKNGGRL